MRDAWRRVRSSCASVAGLLYRALRKPLAKVDRVLAVDRAIQAARVAHCRLVVLKWRFAARAVARTTKVGASLHRLLRVLYTNLHPFADWYLGQVVLGVISDLAFQIFNASFRISQLHSECLRLEFEAVQLLHLGKAHG